MATFDFKPLDLEGAFLISNFSTGDNRGGFTKCFEKDIFAQAGINFTLNETFYSYSSKNVIRGLHFQTNAPQAKLVTVMHGSVWDVIVDLRLDSPTFKQWRAFELSSENHLSLFIPKGFAHGFASLQSGTVMLYQCDGKYDKESDTGIRFNDKTLGISWPISFEEATYSERDIHLPSLLEYLNSQR